MNAPERIYIAPNTSNPHAGMWLDAPLRENTIEYIRADLAAQPAPVPSEQALSDAYDRGVAFAVRKFVKEQPAQPAPVPVPVEELRYLLGWCNGLDGVETVEAWLNTQRAADEGSDAAPARGE